MEKITFKDIEEMVSGLESKEDPKGFIFLPDIDGIRMYEIDAKTLRRMLSMKGMLDRPDPFSIPFTPMIDEDFDGKDVSAFINDEYGFFPHLMTNRNVREKMNELESKKQDNDVCSLTSLEEISVKDCPHHDGVICEIEECKHYVGK